MKQMKFSKKRFEAEDEKRRKETSDYLQSDKYQSKLEKNKHKVFPDVPGLKEYFEGIKNFERVKGKTLLDYVKDKKEAGVKECEAFLKSMDKYADGQQWLKPNDNDEFAGFFMWLYNTGDNLEMEVDRDLYLAFHDYHHKKIEAKKTEKKIDPLTFINPEIHSFFINAEKKALGEIGKFNSVVRCAAFCELLYEKKYITNTKTRRVTMNAFSNSRYGINILNALAATKKAARDKHKTKKVKGLIPLKNCV
jgi:hypothetical protein